MAHGIFQDLLGDTPQVGEVIPRDRYRGKQWHLTPSTKRKHNTTIVGKSQKISCFKNIICLVFLYHYYTERNIGELTKEQMCS